VLIRGPPADTLAAMSNDPRHQLGREGERLAAEHLERLGYEIVARNHRTRYGEIDLVACDARTLVVVEVKSRRGRGCPWDALNELKRRQVRRMGFAYLAEVAGRPRRRDLRFDAIGVTFDSAGRLAAIDHLENAF
jgi:putative endonuclease